MYKRQIENKTESEKQGYILDYLYTKYPDKLVIFALDYNLDLGALKILKEIYGVNMAPTIVINETKLEGLQSARTVESFLVPI